MTEQCENQDDAAAFRYCIASLTFSDQTEVTLPSAGVVLIVGPNNAGKSRTLKDVVSHIGGRRNKQAPVVVTSIVETREGDANQFFSWLCSRAQLKGAGTIAGVGFNLSTSSISEHARSRWMDRSGLHEYGRAVAVLLDTETRLTAANPCESYDAVAAQPTEPIQALYENPGLEKRVSDAFRKAYGKQLVVNRLGGTKIHLHVGEPPDATIFGGELAVEYQRQVRALPLLHEQGDGMRSFVACLIFSDVVEYPVILIDEPETFLHQNSARILAQHLARATAEQKRQLFIATHSGDILRGILDSAQDRVTVIRLERQGERNHAMPLGAETIRRLWADPLLRVSNILDGLFHEHVCLCEADTDVRFYSAVLDAECDVGEVARPDVLFTHCGGKHRMPSVARALRSVGVSLTIIADIDLLNGESPLKSLWESLGQDWTTIESEWKILNSAIADTRTLPPTRIVRQQITELLEQQVDTNVSDEVGTQIRELLRVRGGWSDVKRGGAAALPRGQTRSAYERLAGKLHSVGVVLVPVGELEGFLPNVGRKGPAWVNKAIEYDLAVAPELEQAREFVRSLPFMREAKRGRAG